MSRTQRNLRDAFIVVYLAVQVALPWRALILGHYDTRGHFSWNMYSQRYECRVRYVLTSPSGEARDLVLAEHFIRPQRINMVFYRDVLPDFHAYLCETYRQRGELGTLQGDVICSWNDEPLTELVDIQADLCRAPNFGVLRP